MTKINTYYVKNNNIVKQVQQKKKIYIKSYRIFSIFTIIFIILLLYFIMFS